MQSWCTPQRLMGQYMYSSLLLKLGAKRRLVVSCTPWLLYHQVRGKNAWYPLNRRLEGPYSCSGGRFGENKIFCTGQESKHIASVVQPNLVTILTELFHLIFITILLSYVACDTFFCVSCSAVFYVSNIIYFM